MPIKWMRTGGSPLYGNPPCVSVYFCWTSFVWNLEDKHNWWYLEAQIFQNVYATHYIYIYIMYIITWCMFSDRGPGPFDWCEDISHLQVSLVETWLFQYGKIWYDLMPQFFQDGMPWDSLGIPGASWNLLKPWSEAIHGLGCDLPSKIRSR